MKRIPLKTTLSVLLVLSSIAIQAQDSDTPTKDLYLSYFGNDSTTIHMTHIPCYSADFGLTLTGVIYTRDTIRINGNLYYYSTPKPLGLITEPEHHYLFPRQDTLYLREERETGRLYRYYRDYFGRGETEKMICDMTLEIGDEFVFPSHGLCLDEATYLVSQVNYNNGIKSILLFDGYVETTFTEGQFPSQFPLWQELLPEWESYWEGSGSMQWSDLLCEYKDGELVFGNSSGCYANFWGIYEMSTKHVSIYPNSINGDEIITIESTWSVKDIILIDLFGRIEEITIDKTDNTKWQMRVNGHYTQGMHFITVITEIGIVYEKVLLLD